MKILFCIGRKLLRNKRKFFLIILGVNTLRTQGEFTDTNLPAYKESTAAYGTSQSLDTQI